MMWTGWVLGLGRFLRNTVLWALAVLAAAPVATAQTCGLIGGLPSTAISWSTKSYWWDQDGEGPLPARLVVAGYGHSIGSLASPNIAILNEATGEWEALGEGLAFPATVNTITSTPDGRLIVAGTFTASGGQGGSGLAIWDGDRWTTVGPPNAIRYTTATTTPEGDILAAGVFPDGEFGLKARVVRLRDGAWSFLGPELFASILALAVTDTGEIFAGGNFWELDFSDSLMRWDGTRWVRAGQAFGNASVKALLPTRGGGLIVAGSIAFLNDNRIGNILHWTGTGWEVLASSADGPILSLCLRTNGDLIVGGDFHTIDGVAADGVAVRTESGWEALSPTLSEPVYSITENNLGQTVVSGWVRGGACKGSHLLRLDGGSWQPLVGGLDFGASATCAVSDREIYVGGGFNFIGDGCHSRIIRWDGERWHGVGDGIGTPTMNVRVTRIERMPGGGVIVGGTFESIGNLRVNNIAKWDGAAWSALGSGLTSTAGEVRIGDFEFLPNGDLLVYGFFTHAGGEPAACLARWDGTAWHPFADPISPFALGQIVAMPDGSVALTGLFAEQDPRSRAVSRWDGVQWSEIGPQWGLRSNVSIALDGNGDLIAVGSFRTLTGLRYAARWDGTAWTPFGRPSAPLGGVIIMDDGTIVAARTQWPYGVVIFDGLAWRDLFPYPLDHVWGISSIPNTKEILLSGSFSVIDGELAVAGFARARLPEHTLVFHDQPPPEQAVCTDEAIELRLASNAEAPLRYRWIARGSGSWTPIDPVLNPSAITAKLCIDLPQLGIVDYRCEITDVCGTIVTPDYRVTGVNAGAVCCRADWNRSGGVDGDDITAFFTDWQIGGGDIDRSGGTDGDDIAFFFSRWQAGC